MFGVAFTLEGVPELRGKFRRLVDVVARKVLADAVRAGVKPILQTARQLAPHRLIRRSLGSTVKVYRDTLTVVGLVGPRRGFEDPKKRGRFVVQRRGTKAPPGATRATRIAHLFEGGTKDRYTKAARAYRGRMRKSPFLGPAVEANQDRAQQAMSGKLREGIEREAPLL